MSYAFENWEKEGPSDMKRTLKNQNSVTNGPQIESEKNYMWPSLQINVANAQASKADKCLCTGFTLIVYIIFSSSL